MLVPNLMHSVCVKLKKLTHPHPKRNLVYSCKDCLQMFDGCCKILDSGFDHFSVIDCIDSDELQLGIEFRVFEIEGPYG